MPCVVEPADPLDPALYAAARRPLAEASTPPRWFWTSPAFHAAELERVFLREWLFVGREEEVAEPGRFLAAETAVGPVLLLRDEAGVLRAFANVCRHRGSRLKEGVGKCGSVVCPYHSWVYGLDGRLERAQGMEGAAGFAREQFALKPLRLETWGGFVFVNHDPAAGPLLDHLGDFVDHFAGHRPEAMRCVRRVDFDIAANWKLVLENALEAYHTGTVHRDTLGRQAGHAVPTRGQWTALWVEGDESIATLPGEPPGFEPVPGLAGRAATGTFFTLVFPNTQFAVAQDCLWWLSVLPRGHGRCTLTVGSCFPEATVARADFQARVQPYYRRWDLATPEDNRIAERQQAGLASALWTPGRFSPEEFAVHAMDNWVLDRVLDAPR